MPNHQDAHGQEEQAMILSRSEISVGPLPDPLVLEKYKNADPSFPERIVRMAEAHNKADVSTKNRVSLSHLIVPIIGQVFTLALGAGGILAGIYLARAGFANVAIATIACCFSPVVISVIRGFHRR